MPTPLLVLTVPFLKEAVRDLIEGYPKKYLGPRSCIPPIGTGTLSNNHLARKKNKEDDP